MALQSLYYFNREQNLQQNHLINPSPSSNKPTLCSVGFFLSTGKQAVSCSNNRLYFRCWVFLNNLAFWSHTTTTVAAAAVSKDCSLSAATSAISTTSAPPTPYQLFQSPPPVPQGILSPIHPFGGSVVLPFLLGGGEGLFKHPTIMHISRYLPVFAVFVLAVSWQSKPAVFSSNTFCRVGTQTFHITRQLVFTSPWLIIHRALIPFSL